MRKIILLSLLICFLTGCGEVYNWMRYGDRGAPLREGETGYGTEE